ncbi:uncharacterized protein LOC134262194 [Saccostrea cucullata]|uniref:uncharacterized protein LOC134262194 n=1 Tax=Saccostrea cuccullata TaxID=36930 RepID=UPI002ED10F3A
MKEIYLEDSSGWKTGLAISGVFAILIVFGIAGAYVYRRRRGGFWRKGTEKAVSIDGLAEQNEENDLRGLQSTRYNNPGNNTVSKDSEPSIQKLKKDESESITQGSDVKQNNDIVPVHPKEINVEITSDFTLERNTYVEPKNMMCDEANNMAFEERQLRESYVILHPLENLDTCNNELGPYSNGFTNVDDSNTYLT